ncbi:hypothetical protein Q8G31_29965 [Priestia megaterium]|uniref:hypothetical protein n=1 Tax=Priestia megaterium TaxID=1404 RepID=UPI0027309A2A|nr:hypothetical protein [Priestia megaterium]MDP1383878.1 hypothetical protein [Priestia megaterium]MDP1428031.1 hypothetical protein [Priestia megaterium]
MYQGSYPYGYYYDYMNNMNNYRDFASKVGTFHTVLSNIPVSGGTIPSGSRVFIHSVRTDAAGNEIVTIVFPQMGPGGNCIAGATEVLGSVLETLPPVHHIHHGTPPRPPR